MSLQVSVITPDKTVLSDRYEEVILPSRTGQLGILSGHAPLLTALDAGVMRVRSTSNGAWENVALMDGFAEVENDEIKVLVNGAVLGSAIDLDAARQEFQGAKEHLEQATAKGDRQEIFLATKEVARTRARVQAAGGTV